MMALDKEKIIEQMNNERRMTNKGAISWQLAVGKVQCINGGLGQERKH